MNAGGTRGGRTGRGDRGRCVFAASPGGKAVRAATAARGKGVGNSLLRWFGVAAGGTGGEDGGGQRRRGQA